MSGRADKVPEVVYAESREEAQRLLDESYLKKYRAVPVEGDTIRRTLEAISPPGITGTEGPAALQALDALLAENQRLRAYGFQELLDKNRRLRDALERIERMKNLGMVTDAVQEMQQVAREALAGDTDG